MDEKLDETLDAIYIKSPSPSSLWRCCAQATVTTALTLSAYSRIATT